MLRMRVLGTLSVQAERPAAIAFVRRIAMQEPRHEDFPGAVHEAIATLLAMHDEGRAALRELHARGLVRDPEERRGLDHLAQNDFRFGSNGMP